MLPTHKKIGPLSGISEFQKSPFATKGHSSKSENLMRAAYSLRSVLLQGQGLQGYELEVSEAIKSEGGIQSTGVAVPLSCSLVTCPLPPTANLLKRRSKKV